VVGLRNNKPFDVENDYGMQLIAASLPGTTIKTFQIGTKEKSQTEKTFADESLLSSDSKVILYAAPSFLPKLDDALAEIETRIGRGNVFGAIASTVSSLSRPLLFSFDFEDSNDIETVPNWLFNAGAIGVSFSGDIEADFYISQGASKIGPLFSIEKLEENTIQTISSNEFGDFCSTPLSAAKKVLKSTSENEKTAVFFGLMRSDLSQQFSDSAEVVIRPVSFGSKDGSITATSEKVSSSDKIQFYVKNSKAAVESFERTVAAYKSNDEFKNKSGGLIHFSCISGGQSLYNKPAFEAERIAEASSSQIGGFFCNGVFGPIDGKASKATLFGSSSGFVSLRPKSGRVSVSLNGSDDLHEIDEIAMSDADENFEIVRRNVGSGRSLNSGQVQYSVAENTAKTRNVLEKMCWEKEAEVDRRRDRWPVGPLMTRVLNYNKVTENKAKDLKSAIVQSTTPALIGIVKRKSPNFNNRKEAIYDPVSTLEKYTKLGSLLTAVGLHSDSVFYGGNFEQIEEVRAKVKVPLLLMDVIVYVYQLYEIRLKGVDAIRLISAALPKSDLVLFHKVANKIGMQVVVTVSSAEHLLSALEVDGIAMVSITERDLGTFEVNGGRVERILGDERVKSALGEMGENKPVILVEGGLKLSDFKIIDWKKINGAIIGEALLLADEIEKDVREAME